MYDLMGQLSSNSSGLSDMISSLMSSFVSYSGVLLLLILETIILFKARIPMYGLRFVPIYGEYYFFQSLVPEKKIYNIWHIVLQCLKGVITIVFAFVCVFAIFVSIGSSHDDDLVGIWTSVAVFFLIFFAVCIADLVIMILVRMELAERYAFNKYLGILFAFFPLINDICCLVNADRYNNMQSPYATNYDNFDGYSGDVE